MGIGSNIRRLRTDAGMSQEQLGNLLGKTRSAVSYYESDSIIPRMGVIEDLASIFGVSKTEIIETGQKDATGHNEVPAMGASLSSDESEILGIMRTITQEGQRQLMIYARGLLATYPKSNQVQKTA